MNTYVVHFEAKANRTPQVTEILPTTLFSLWALTKQPIGQRSKKVPPLTHSYI
jgi:hypothetical protein